MSETDYIIQVTPLVFAGLLVLSCSRDSRGASVCTGEALTHLLEML